jgi:hypothetical protein
MGTSINYVRFFFVIFDKSPLKSDIINGRSGSLKGVSEPLTFELTLPKMNGGCLLVC